MDDTVDVFNFLKIYQELYGDTIYFVPTEEPETTVQQEVKNENPLHEYFTQIQDCKKCELGKTRTRFVFGAGNPDADLVFVGEAPGKDEDLQGIPFVGRAGKLLDNILEAIQLTRDDVYILNVLKCRPPNNRDPLPSEVELCEPYLIRQLEIINPKLIVCLGRISGKTLLRLDLPLGKMRENIYSYNGIDTIVTYHPAALLRNPNFKKPTWEDFKKIRDRYLTRD